MGTEPVNRIGSIVGRLLIPVLAVACLLAGCGTSRQPARTVAPEPDPAEGTDSILGALGFIDEELLIEAFPDVDPDVIAELLEQLDAATLEELDQLLIGVDPNDLEGIAEDLEASGLIESVQKNYLYEPDPVSDQPLPTVRQTPGATAGAAARGVTFNPNAITIAIVDSGIDATHPLLIDGIVGGWNVYANTADYGDVTGHGTAVAAVVTAVAGGRDSISTASLANPLLAVRVTDDQGRASSHDLAAGILWSVNHGAKVINVSFAAAAPDAIVRSAADYARSRGAIVVIGTNSDRTRVEGDTDTRYAGVPVRVGMNSEGSAFAVSDSPAK